MAPLKNISGKFSPIKVGRSGREMRSMLLDHISHNLFTNLSLPSYNLLGALLYVFACVVLFAYLLWCAYITFYHCLFILLTTTSLMLFSICLCLCRAICLPALLSLCDFLPLSICIAIFTCLYLSQFVLQNVSITSSQCVFACFVLYICLYHLPCIAVST